MTKEMPLSVEWMPQHTYVHGSLDHLLPENRNQHDYMLVKQETEFFDDTLNAPPVHNLMRLQISSKKDKEEKQRIDSLIIPDMPCQTDSLNELPKKVTEVSHRLCSKGRIDVIEMSTEPMSDYKYFLIYEDQQSEFVILKALRSDMAKEVAVKLLDILAIVGAPQVLQSGNGQEFVEQVVHELRMLWNNFLILPGDTVTYEANYRDFKGMLKSWTQKNPTKSWREGLNLVQIFHNTTYRCRNGKAPCDALFGRSMCENFHSLGTKRDMEDLWSQEEWIEHLSSEKNRNMIATAEMRNVPSSVNHYEKNENFQSISSKNNDLDDLRLVGAKALANSTRTDLLCVDPIQTDPIRVDIKDDSKDNEDMPSLACKYCQKRYTKLGHLKNHMKTHKAGGRVLRCELCSKTFSVPRLYGKHMKQSHGQNKLSEGEDCTVRRSTRSNTVAAAMRTAVHKEEVERIVESPCETFNIDSVKNEKCNTLDLRDACGKTGKSSNLTTKRKSSVENRTSRVQCALQCTYCKQKFSFPSVLERHMRSHTNERPYECNICNKSFKQLGHLSQHSLTHHDYRSFQCTVCGVKMDSLDSLKQHSHSHSHSRSHSRSHRGDATTLKMRDVYRLFECDSCKKIFTTKSVLERHIFTHTQERQFDCKVCGKRFKQAGHVKSHMLVHTGERRFQCTICSKRFSLSNSLKKHMYVHNGEKPYQCDVCGARFLEKRNLNGHLLTHTNERPYCCKICGKRYTLADTLRRHVSAAHEDGRTYQCEICAKMFKQLAHLSVHKKVHNDERPFQCHLCEKNFKHKNVLKSHLAIHANVRPFECDICKATFVRKTNLQTHISSAHMNERPYTCTICNKRFKQISHLNGHVVVHSNLMPYKCNFCDRRCNRLDNLKKHMRLHTKNKE